MVGKGSNAKPEQEVGHGVADAGDGETLNISELDTLDEDVFGPEEGPGVTETTRRSRDKLVRGKRDRQSSPVKQMTLRNRKRHK